MVVSGRGPSIEARFEVLEGRKGGPANTHPGLGLPGGTKKQGYGKGRKKKNIRHFQNKKPSCGTQRGQGVHPRGGGLTDLEKKASSLTLTQTLTSFHLTERVKRGQLSTKLNFSAVPYVHSRSLLREVDRLAKRPVWGGV